jgi:hypothetical protein
MTQQVMDRDSSLRDVISCDLLLKETVRLMECSRYRGLKNEQEMKKEVVDEVVITGDLEDLKKFKEIIEIKKGGWPKGVPRKRA